MSRSRLHLYSLALGASLFSLTIGSRAFAADAAPAADGAAIPGDIVVTAQRREQSANDVPVSIEAFSGAELDRLRVKDINDLSFVVPGFNIVRTGEGVPNYYIRGIGFNTINQSSTATVGTYVDEVAYAYPLMNAGPVFDLERVEVLKGPQGTLFGRNTTAGLIDFVTGKPTETFHAHIAAEGGNYGTHNVEGMISGPITGWLQGRLAFRTEDSEDGWQKSLSRDERLGEVHRYGARASLAAQPLDGLHIDLSYNFWLNRSDTQAGQAIAFAPTAEPATGTYGAFNNPGLASYLAAHRPNSAEDADWTPYSVRSADNGTPGTPGFGPGTKDKLAEDTQFHAGKLRVAYDLGERVQLVSLTGYNHLDRRATNDTSSAPFQIYTYQNDAKIRSLSEELRLEGKTRLVDWMVGGYYGRDRLYDSAVQQEGDTAPVNLVRYLTGTLLSEPINTFGYTPADVQYSDSAYRDSARFRTKTWSVFANAEWKITPTLSLTTAIRYTQDDQRFRGCTSDYEGSLVPVVNLFNRSNWALLPSSGGVPPAPIGLNQCNTYLESENRFGYFVSSLSEDNVAWRVAPSWHVTPDIMLYASASRGAKNGTIPVLAATRAEQNTPAKQELLTAYEIGTKAGFLRRRAQLNAAFFYYDYKNKQAVANFSDPVYTVLTQLQNIPKSEAYGIDADLTLRPFDRFTLSAGGTWLKTRIRRWETIGNDGSPIDASGLHFAFAPEFSGNVTALYDQPINDRLVLSADASVRFQSKSNATQEDDPLYRIKAYQVVNGSVSLHDVDNRWRLSVWARNLFNEYYWTQVSNNSNLIFRYAGQPRTFGGTVAYNF